MLVVNTPHPEELLAALRRAVDSRKIEAWSCDHDGDYTYDQPPWRGKAFLRPVVIVGALKFVLLGQQNALMTKAAYGVYLGRFIELLLAHFDDRFTGLSATASVGSGSAAAPTARAM